MLISPLGLIAPTGQTVSQMWHRLPHSGWRLQPIEHADAAEDRETAAERAGEAAIEALDEQARGDNDQRVGDHRPFGHEAKNDGGS